MERDGIEEQPLNEINTKHSDSSTQPSEPAAKSQNSQPQLPWYLQVQQPLPQPELPLSDRQRLPDLPLHSPALLQPILEHVSIELGMDDLSLLDMRTLDPPPALGANLLMVVGTARSEKHLHVSADRLCRWLRTQYKLSPYADGLLGRNELKLKLRRKAKRTRLLSAVGAKETAQTDIDDGIRTGWVCVNIGRVPGGELPQEDQSVQNREGVVGFGSITGGSSIVVQLMTEDKRGEIDLEKLWTDALHRSDRRKQKLMEEEREGQAEMLAQVGDEVVGSAELPVDHQSTAQLSSSPPTYRPQTVSTVPSQIRAFHTSARHRAVTAATVAAPTPPLPSKSSAGPSTLALERHIAQLKRMKPARALEALGPDLLRGSARLDLGDGDVTVEREPAPKGSAFANGFYGSMPAFPGPEHYHLHFELMACARQLGHAQLHSPVFAAQLKSMQVAGFVPEERTFKLILRSVLSPLGRRIPYDGATQFPSEGKMHLVLSILEDMEACGYDPMTAEILELLHTACLGPRLHPLHMQQLQNMIPALRVARLRRHVREDDWQAFWRTWHAYPRHFLPRTSQMYAVLFTAIADGKTGDLQEARSAMKIYVPEMAMEEPPVTLDGPLARALQRALAYVEPSFQETDDMQPATVSREWMALYEQCRSLLRGPEPGKAAD